jgi:molybdopterin molybdotransferase
MTGFDTIVVADWSARSTPSPARPSKDAIFLGICRDGYVATLYQRTRSQAMRSIRGLIDGDLRAGRRILAGLRFPLRLSARPWREPYR